MSANTKPRTPAQKKARVRAIQTQIEKAQASISALSNERDRLIWSLNQEDGEPMRAIAQDVGRGKASIQKAVGRHSESVG